MTVAYFTHNLSRLGCLRGGVSKVTRDLDGFKPREVSSTPFWAPFWSNFRARIGPKAAPKQNLEGTGPPEGDFCKICTAPQREAHFCLHRGVERDPKRASGELSNDYERAPDRSSNDPVVWVIKKGMLLVNRPGRENKKVGIA